MPSDGSDRRGDKGFPTNLNSVLPVPLRGNPLGSCFLFRKGPVTGLRGTSVNLNMEFRLEFLGFSRGNFLFPHYRRTDPLSVSLVYAVRTLPLITARLSLFFLHRLGSLFWSKYATQLFVVCLTHILCLQVHCALWLEVDGT